MICVNLIPHSSDELSVSNGFRLLVGEVKLGEGKGERERATRSRIGKRRSLVKMSSRSGRRKEERRGRANETARRQRRLDAQATGGEGSIGRRLIAGRSLARKRLWL